VVVGLCLARTASPEEPVSIDVTLKDHRFSPSEIHVGTGNPAVLKIRNEDALKVEKVVAAGASVTVRLRPLGPGRFPFMGEFHPDTAQGVVISE
jgi:Cupredoxin-like domain